MPIYLQIILDRFIISLKLIIICFWMVKGWNTFSNIGYACLPSNVVAIFYLAFIIHRRSPSSE